MNSYLRVHKLQDTTGKKPIASQHSVKAHGSHSETLRKHKVLSLICLNIL
jgi:hypothetical protein